MFLEVRMKAYEAVYQEDNPDEDRYGDESTSDPFWLALVETDWRGDCLWNESRNLSLSDCGFHLGGGGITNDEEIA